MIQIRYVVSVLCRYDPLNAVELGDSARSVVSMELRAGTDGVGESKVNKWVMEKCLENRRGCKCFPLLMGAVKLTF